MSDAGAEWPEDPSDPRCPECDGKVAATSSYCMHCEADLPPADFDPAETATGVDADVATGDGRTGAASGATDPVGADADAGEGWFHPDSLLDDVTTVAVGAVGGTVAAVAATATLLFALPGIWPFLVGLSTWGAAIYRRGRPSASGLDPEGEGRTLH